MPPLRELLQSMVEKRGSDLHVACGTPPQLRIDGALVTLPFSALSPSEAKELCYEALTPGQVRDFELKKELDLSFSIGGLSRFRANIYIQKDTVAGAFRNIPFAIPLPEQLGLPKAALDLIHKPRGMVLVTGPTGSGKSTTLASLIDQINATRPVHIITVEDPIEFVHEHKKAIVSQREIGKDSASFAEALKHILRQAPDVILVGEMRDLETIAAAITISETGHLVFATLHTNTAIQTINRIVDVFPPYQQPQVRTQLSFILEGVISQQLVPKTGGGRILAAEILLPNHAIRNLIREDKIHQIQAAMQTGQGQSGMQTMNQALTDLVKKNLVSYDDAFVRATDAEEFARMAKPSAVSKLSAARP